MTEQWEHTDAKLAEQWTRIRALLRAEVGDAAFNSWLKPLTLGEILGTRLRIAVPTRFMRDWIEQNYGTKLTEFWKEEMGCAGKHFFHQGQFSSNINS